jgi:hypothetical protein
LDKDSENTVLGFLLIILVILNQFSILSEPCLLKIEMGGHNMGLTVLPAQDYYIELN